MNKLISRAGVLMALVCVGLLSGCVNLCRVTDRSTGVTHYSYDYSNHGFEDASTGEWVQVKHPDVVGMNLEDWSAGRALAIPASPK